MIVAAGDERNSAWREQLNRLIAEYWKPAYGYLRACGVANVENAKDLTQEFFARLFEKGLIARLNPSRGSFRGFLMRALKNFAVDAARHEKARRPPSGALLISLEDCRDAESRAQPGEDADRVFDREWTRAVMRSALAELDRRMGESYAAYRNYTEGNETYVSLEKKMGLTENDVRYRLSRCREELRAILREKIRDYVRDESDVETELREIVKG